MSSPNDATPKEAAPPGPDPLDPIAAAARRLAERLRPVLYPGIKSFETKTLATFTWVIQSKKSTSVILKEVLRP